MLLPPKERAHKGQIAEEPRARGAEANRLEQAAVVHALGLAAC